MLPAVLSDIDSTQPQSIAALQEFLRIPSVSAQPEHAPDMQAAAQFLSDHLKASGLWARIEPTGGHPLVLAGTERRPGRPTVLIYGHYDVQPAEPLDEWVSPPFEPAIRPDSSGAPSLYARGACDDKGQVWAHVQAIAAWARHASEGELPVNLILLIEGEEEISSVNLERWVREHRQQLAADVAVISDSGQFSRGLPAITYGLRGLAYMEITVSAASHDLHSGVYGGAAPNPANILCQLLATLHDSSGRVNIPGFYDAVVPLTSGERQMWQSLPSDDEAMARELGLARDQLGGEASYTTTERRWARPTCDINGLASGYQGPGAKTIIPAKASAKVSMRLVPHQDPAAVAAAFEKAMRDRCPASARVQVVTHGLAVPAMVPVDSRAMRLAAAAVQTGFGRAPVFIREGGTIPVVALLKSTLGVDSLLVGFGLPDDRLHSPNEKFGLDCLHQGTRTAAALYDELAKLRG